MVQAWTFPHCHRNTTVSALFRKRALSKVDRAAKVQNEN